MLVNKTRFPSFNTMTETAHSLGLTASWYLNSDPCRGKNETSVGPTYTTDSQDAAKYGFNGVKFDTEGGGPSHNITLWAMALNATGKPMLIENCDDKNPTYLLADPTDCPYNHYRTGPDNSPSFFGGLNHVFTYAVPYLRVTHPVPASRPGCFAYPDILGIGAPVKGTPAYAKARAAGCANMTMDEERTVFANWAIISSPLVLGLDTRDDEVVARYWPIIGNKKALEVNSDWAGSAGTLWKQSSENRSIVLAPVGCECESVVMKGPDGTMVPRTAAFPEWLLYTKRLRGGAVAALLINMLDAKPLSGVGLTLAELHAIATGTAEKYVARDVWTGASLGEVTSMLPWSEAALGAHNSSFVTFTPTGTEPAGSGAPLKGDEEPNPPQWPPTVHVFGPDSDDIEATVQRLYGGKAWSQAVYQEQRAALFFKPGRYTTDVPVGYYTTVHGLGAAPGDVSLEGPRGVHQGELGDPGANSATFWRSAENLANRPTSGRTLWSVSQAAPLRRMVVEGDLVFGTAADTQGSGGFVSGVQVTGVLNFTMQQQWIARNCELGAGGTSFFEDPPRSVNFVFVGTSGAPEPTTACTNSAVDPVSPVPQELVVDRAPLSMEKPFITIDGGGKYHLVTPRAWADTRGVQWDLNRTRSHTDGFERVFVASNATAVTEINAKLAAGLHVVLAPGVYSLPEPIRIGRPGSRYQVLLGLGMATLVPENGGAAVEVSAPGVRVAGILLQAGPVTSKALITVGSSPAAGEASNPILLADVFARVGGPGVDPETGLGPAVSATMMMEVNASHVVLDNVWLWRADIANAGRSRDCNHSLVVNGHNVTAFGLAAEHVQSDNTVWNGEHGRVYFYQAELDGLAHKLIDHTPGFGPDGVSGYRVNAKAHEAVGVGVYCWFSSPGIIVQAGVKVLHADAAGGIVCPFKWVWENGNTPPAGNSTIQEAILVVGGAPARGPLHVAPE
jgi:hypothetical protein